MDNIIKKAGLSYIELLPALKDVSDIKKSQYALQVMIVCLYKMFKKAYLQSGSSVDILYDYLGINER